MKPNRSLALRRDELTELTPDQLGLASGAWAPPTMQSDCDEPGELLLYLTLHRHCSWSCI